ncbi:ThiS domain protein [Lunatimonas lonarensis]|uniref:ThiS domain protein n=1 Tax=Lunatimonas lonarensis TaxID=1232681 RepID=R7ZR51_9BACT|nr:MoaD/ThiS family protein [Lunatimonas lonarensis]EON76538.1 ThiS domain protein [Lunatimonas lonarensis]
MASVIIPTPLRKFTDNTVQVEIEGETVAEILEGLVSLYPGLKTYLRTADGNLPSFINIFVDQDDIRSLKMEQSVVKNTSVVSIVPAIAGGGF